MAVRSSKVTNMIQWVRAHNSSHRSVTKVTSHLRQYSFFAYICILNCYSTFIYYTRQKCKERRYKIIHQ